MKNKKKTLYDKLKALGLYEMDNVLSCPIYINGEISNYLIQSNGVIVASKSGIKMAGGIDYDGYHIIALTHKKKRYTRKYHRLVAEAFIPNPSNKPEVNHKDGNNLNNRVDNLEWVYSHNNTHHASERGLRYGLYDESIIHEVCGLLESNMYSIKEIAIMTGVKEVEIRRVLNGCRWVSVSSKYDLSKYIKAEHKYIPPSIIGIDKIITICELLESNKYNTVEIGKLCKVTVHTVWRILHKKCHTNISNAYDFTKYKKRKNQFI